MQLRKRTSIIRRCVPLVFLAALASCGPFSSPPAAAKVDVDTLSTDIVFGAPTPGAKAPAQTAQPPLAAPGLEQPGFTGFGGLSFALPTFTQTACPTAPATSFPAQVATSDVSTMPASGQYLWAAGGQYEKLVLTITLKLPVPTFEQRVVRQAATITDPVPAAPGSPPDYAFTYQTIEPRVSDGTSLLMYWQVKANANQVSTGVAPTVADPEGGLVLKRVDTLDSSGKDTRTIFSTANEGGLLLLPLPVQPGASINSTAVDTSGSGNTLQLTGTVGNRERVDACGTPIQAWGVDGTLTTGGATAANPATVHYDVATQMGALIVTFNMDGSFFGTKFDKETARIGQINGDPVPAQYK